MTLTWSPMRINGSVHYCAAFTGLDGKARFAYVERAPEFQGGWRARIKRHPSQAGYDAGTVRRTASLCRQWAEEHADDHERRAALRHPGPEELAAFAEGNLPLGWRHSVVVRHLAGCEDCRGGVAAVVEWHEQEAAARERIAAGEGWEGSAP